jgi:peptidoglycan biosynthesis protein MviN/MurJ (putative lipid II flippase)
VRATIGLILGRLPNFLIPLVSARVFGVTEYTDYFFLSWALTSFLAGGWNVLGEVVSVPFILRWRSKGWNAKSYIRWLGVLQSAGGLTFSVVGGWFSVLWGILPEEAFFLFMIPTSVYVILAGRASAYTALLMSKGRYVEATGSPAVTSAFVLAGMYCLSGVLGEGVLPLAYGAGELARLCFLVVRSRGCLKEGSEAPWGEFRRELVHWLKVSGYQLAGTFILGLYPVMDRVWLEGAGRGDITLLSYAERLWAVPVSLFTGGFLSVSLVRWSRWALEEEERHELVRNTLRVAGTVFICSLPAAGVAIVIREPLIHFLFSERRLAAEEIARLSSVFGVLAAGLPTYLAAMVIVRAIMAVRGTHYLCAIAVIELGAKIAGNAVLVPRLGLAGAASSTVLMYTVGGLLQAIALAFDCRRVSPGTRAGVTGSTVPRGEP